MRLAYLVNGYGEIPGGVLRKIEDQLRIWIEAGNQVFFCVVVRDRSFQDRLQELLPQVDCVTLGYSSIKQRFEAISSALVTVRAWHPELVYHRYDIFHPGITRFAREVPVVIEINSDDVREYQRVSLPFGFYNRITRGRLLDAATGFCFVSNELSQAIRYRRFTKPSLVAANSIDLSSFNQSSAPTNEFPVLVFIGDRWQRWHGVDRLLKLANHFPEWQFNLIGYNQEHLFVDCPPNVHLHGYMRADEYRKLLLEADVAVSSLAFDRLGMREASPLKNREYLACGLPVIMAFTDTDFPDGADYLLELPGAFDPDDKKIVDSIEKFVSRWRGSRVDLSDVACIDVRFKERRRLEFFRQLLLGVE